MRHKNCVFRPIFHTNCVRARRKQACTDRPPKNALDSEPSRDGSLVVMARVGFPKEGMRRRVCLQTPVGWRGTEERVVRKMVGMPRINHEEHPAPRPAPSANVRRMRIDTSHGRAGVFPPQDLSNRDGCMLLDGDLPATRAAQRSRSPNTSPPFPRLTHGALGRLGECHEGCRGLPKRAGVATVHAHRNIKHGTGLGRHESISGHLLAAAASC